MKPTLRVLAAAAAACGRVATFCLLVPIWCYQATLSKIMPPVCRFEPT